MSRASPAEHRAPRASAARRAVSAWHRTGLSIAEGRLQAAKETSVPEPLELAHPHLLLMLEHCERAASAAALGETARYAPHAGASRDEEELFRSVLRRLGGSLPIRS